MLPAKKQERIISQRLRRRKQPMVRHSAEVDSEGWLVFYSSALWARAVLADSDRFSWR